MLLNVNDTTKASWSNHSEVLYKIIVFLQYLSGPFILNVSKIALLSTFDKCEIVVATWVEFRISHREGCSNKFRKTHKNFSIRVFFLNKIVACRIFLLILQNLSEKLFYIITYKKLQLEVFYKKCCS